MADQVKPVNNGVFVAEKSGLTSRRTTSSNSNGGDGVLPLHQGDLEGGTGGGDSANKISSAITPVKETGSINGGVVRSRTRALFAVRPEGQSGRSGFHPVKFLRITFRSASWVSMMVNVLWPLVPAAIAMRYTLNDGHHNLAIFVVSYLAMIPCANLIGFAGGSMAKKVPHVMGVLLETT